MEKFIFYGSIIGMIAYSLIWVGYLVWMPLPALIKLLMLAIAFGAFYVVGKIGWDQMQQNNNEEEDYDNVKY